MRKQIGPAWLAALAAIIVSVGVWISDSHASQCSDLKAKPDECKGDKNCLWTGNDCLESVVVDSTASVPIIELAQKGLNKKGYALKADGIYGEITSEALANFEKKHNPTAKSDFEKGAIAASTLRMLID